MRKRCLISVVVAIYNIERWVEKCIESVLTQSYIDFELILVDDGSTDLSREICEKYCRLDDRIKLISQNNQGLSAARNTGIDVCCGEYIMFLDGDDYLYKDALKNAMENIENSDICIFQYEYVNENGEYMGAPLSYKQKITMNKENALKRLFVDDNIGGIVAWGKLYKKSLFIDNNIYYPVGKYHEDCFTTYKLFFLANTITYIPNVGYYYVQRSDSIMHCKFDKKHLDKIQAADECREFVNKNLPQVRSACECACYKWYLQVVNRVIRAGEMKNEIETLYIIRDKMKNRKIWFNKEVSLKYKILVCIYKVDFDLYKLILLKFKPNDLVFR